MSFSWTNKHDRLSGVFEVTVGEQSGGEVGKASGSAR